MIGDNKNVNLRQIEQRTNVAIFEYLKELITPPNTINEATFDEIRDCTIEHVKQNIDKKNLSEEEKIHAKAAIEITLTEIAQKFKEGMRLSGILK